MAYFENTEYGKYVELQNVSGSGDPATAPQGGIYLFASGTAGNAKLYLQNEGVGTPLSLADGGTLQIAGDSGTDTVNLSGDTFTFAGGEGIVSAVTDNQVSLAVSVADLSTSMTGDLEDTDEFAISDGGTMKKVDFSVVRDAVFADVSGDATVAAGGALTIAADAVESGMLNDNVISGQSELAHADIADADELMISDGGVLKKVGVDSLRDHFFGVVSGDATVADGGALTIAANAVEDSMLNDNVATGLAGAGLAASSGVLSLDIDELDALTTSLHQTEDHFVVSDNGTEKKITFSNLEDSIFGNISGDATVAAGGALTIADGAVEHVMLAGDAVDGDNIADDSVNSEHIALGALDAEHYSSGSIQTGHLANDAVDADKLASNAVVNDSIASNAAIDMDKLDGGSLASSLTDLAQGDLMYAGDLDDSNKLKSITFSNLEDAIFGNVSGDVLVAAGGAATIQADAVEFNMLNDNIISGQNGMAGDIDDTDEFMISDGGTIKKIDFSVVRDAVFTDVSGDATIAAGGAVTLAGAQTNITSLLATDIKIGEDDQTKIDFETENEIHFYADNAEQVFVADGVFGPQTDSDVDLGADGVAFKKLFVDDIDLNGQGRIDLDADGDTSIRSAADDQIQLEVGGSDMVTVLATGMGVNGGYGSGNGSSFGADGTGNFDGNLNVGADGAGASFVIYGATANERMMYDKDNHVLNFRDSSGATMLNLGGDASSEYALDVANGSNNINKVRAAAFVTYSDESLKSDVETMNTALDTVMSLNGVEFTWKDSGERDFGFIAQDVQSVLPKAVHVAEDGVQGVDYSRLTSVLVEAVKAQQVQIEELKTLLKK